MFRPSQHAVVLGATAFSFVLTAMPALAQPAHPKPTAFEVRSANLHRVKSLFDGDTRALWIADSWGLMHHTARLPYGSLMVWPMERLEAVCVGFFSYGLGGSTDYTSGVGALDLPWFHVPG